MVRVQLEEPPEQDLCAGRLLRQRGVRVGRLRQALYDDRHCHSDYSDPTPEQVTALEDRWRRMTTYTPTAHERSLK